MVYCLHLGQRILVTSEVLKLTLKVFLTSNENLWGHLRDWSVRKKEQLPWDFCMDMQGMTVQCGCRY